MLIERHYTIKDVPVEDQIVWKKVNVEIKEKNKTILSMSDIEVPQHWSQSASDILAHKYFRRSGVPSAVEPVGFDDRIPEWLLPKSATDKTVTYGGETSARQVFHRLAGHWTYTGLKHKYFCTDAAKIFYDEIYYMLAMQIAAPNSPQWFNTGLWWAYGIEGSKTNTGYKQPYIGESAEQCDNSYEYPQTSACFILGMKDSLLGERGIMDTATREARIFKYGSGSGVNYSTLRAKGAPLGNGGASSGLMSFLKPLDAFAGAIKSGGTTRRAARMVIVDADHPEALDFVEWKAREEIKVSAMTIGANSSKPDNDLSKEVCASLRLAEYEGEAYNTVSGQNANNSLRVTDKFMEDITYDKEDTNSSKRNKLIWSKLVKAAWLSGDPGLQFHDTINAWHTIPNVAPIRASNPCSEYMFIDDSSCNLASINLIKFISFNDNNTNSLPFDITSFIHVCRLWTIVLDISISMSSYPDAMIAENSVNYRAIGLGYANLGGLLMSLGYPYDSDMGRDIAASITALMHSISWNTSADLAIDLGSFHDYEANASDVKSVFLKHVEALNNLRSKVKDGYNSEFSDRLKDIISKCADIFAITNQSINTFGVRNAQLTLLAPTGTTGLIMDCATTGIEPDFSLVKFKKLAGGGSITLTNPLVDDALLRLGYEAAKVIDISSYVVEKGKIDIFCPHIEKAHIPIFDCANDISVKGHILMMAAVQPFLSGAISKTVNLPNSATEEDVSNAYKLAWTKDIKAIAIYRDGCKLSQPLSAVRADTAAHQSASSPDAAPVGSTVSNRPIAGAKKVTPRYTLPNKRNGFRQKVKINGQTLYLATGEYSDGKLGEVFLNFGRDGSTLRHLLDSLAVTMSIGLQHGVPLQEYVDAFADTRSEPSGMIIGSDTVKMCSSIMDYVVRELAYNYAHLELAVQDQVPESIVDKSDNTAIIKPIDNNDNHNEDIIPDDDSLPKFIKNNDPQPNEGVLSVGIRTMARPRYIGNACPLCESFTLRRSGSCHVCDSCGQTTGCS